MTSLRDRLRLETPVHTFRENARSECTSCPYPRGASVHFQESSRFVEFDEDEEGPQLVNGEVPAGMMVALFPDMETAKALKIPGGEKARSLHVTLAYLPDVDVVDPATLLSVVQDYASVHSALEGEVSGVGVFTAGEGAVTYASVDIPALPEFRQQLVRRLDEVGIYPSMLHGYTPHMTLAYGDKRDAEVPNLPLHFDAITVCIKGKMTSFPLMRLATDETLTDDQTVPATADDGHVTAIVEGTPGLLAPGDVWDAAAEAKKESKGQLIVGKGKDEPHDYKAPDMPDEDGVQPPCDTCGRAKDDQVHGGSVVPDLIDINAVAQTKPRIEPKVLHEGEAPDSPLSKAFVSEVNGKTFITGQAAAFQSLTPTWEKALGPNPHMLWMQGRFVGGEAPNRNGAFWSTADLEMGEPTVKYGPLNWLHEARHVIGVLADSRLRTYDNAREEALDEPYIEAAAGIWRWIYPDEAYVVEQASDQGRLWYSMECISAEVECVGEGGCGERAEYFGYMKGAGCIHMQQRSAIRRFVDPIFLGGAVIVPPVRPGWANADASVMTVAAALAEKSFEDAGQPDVAASEWEQMMAQIVKYAA